MKNIIMDETDEIRVLKNRIKELEAKNLLLCKPLPEIIVDPGVKKLIINPIVDTTAWEDGEIIDKTDELSGRIIFSLNEISAGYCDDDPYEISFYCGPETKDGALDDCDDCGLYPQLEKLLDDFQPSIGDAENYHTVPAVDQVDAHQRWDDIKKLLLAAGAVEKE